MIDELKDDEHAIYCGTDASLPANIRHQAASAYLVHRARYIASRVTAPDAELYAIGKACSLPDVNNITLFTDSIASARRAVNPSVHSGQGHSLAVCRALEQWFANSSHSVTFVMVHSRFEWGPHHEAHEFVRGLPPVSSRHMATSLNSLCKILVWIHGLPCSRTRNTRATTSCCSRTSTEVLYSRLKPKAGLG